LEVISAHVLLVINWHRMATTAKTLTSVWTTMADAITDVLMKMAAIHVPVVMDSSCYGMDQHAEISTNVC